MKKDITITLPNYVWLKIADQVQEDDLKLLLLVEMSKKPKKKLPEGLGFENLMRNIVRKERI